MWMLVSGLWLYLYYLSGVEPVESLLENGGEAVHHACMYNKLARAQHRALGVCKEKVQMVFLVPQQFYFTVFFFFSKKEL